MYLLPRSRNFLPLLMEGTGKFSTSGEAKGRRLVNGLERSAGYISSLCSALPVFYLDLVFWPQNSKSCNCFFLAPCVGHLVIRLRLGSYSSSLMVVLLTAWVWCCQISLKVEPGLPLSSWFPVFLFTQMSNKRSNSFRQAILQGNRRLCSKALLEETGLSLSQRLIRHVAYETLPREIDRKWYYDSYTCCPPPWFMITITIVEVSTLLNALVWGTHPTLPRFCCGLNKGYRGSHLDPDKDKHEAEMALLAYLCVYVNRGCAPVCLHVFISHWSNLYMKLQNLGK